MPEYPNITETAFGSITLDAERYEKDIYILADGTVAKRKKLSLIHI